MKNKESQPQSQQETSQSPEKSFVHQVEIAREIEEEDKKNEYAFQLFLLEKMGIFDKLAEWAEFKQPDYKGALSKPNSGRFVANLRWNFREIEGQKVCDEVGIAYIGEIDTPLIEYKVHSHDDDEMPCEDYELHHERADFFLIWGTRPRIIRYLPHGEVREAIHKLVDEDNMESFGMGIWDRQMTRLITSDEVHLMEAVDYEETMRKLQDARTDSYKHFEEALIWALNNPMARLNPTEKIRSPFREKIGQDPTNIFEKLERRIRRRELKDKMIIKERERKRQLTTLEKVQEGILSGGYTTYEEELTEEMMFLDDYEQQLEEELYSRDLPHPQEGCYDDIHDERCEDYVDLG
jgi:hypothetical protein